MDTPAATNQNKNMKYKTVKLNEKEIAMIKHLISSTNVTEYSPLSARASLQKKLRE